MTKMDQIQKWLDQTRAALADCASDNVHWASYLQGRIDGLTMALEVANQTVS